jgi:zinc/manganese transport system ATP-binding protein
MSEVVLRFSDVTWGYGLEHVIRGISGELRSGSLLGLMGPNGGGKTTFLRGVKGEILLQGGTLWSGYGEDDVGYLPQKPEIRRDFPVKVREVVEGGALRHLGWWREGGVEVEKRVEESLIVMGLEGLGGADLVSLSEGQLRRVLMARMWVGDYGLNLLDEPFEYLDEEGGEALACQLRKMRSEGKTVILSLHSGRVAEELLDEVVMLSRSGCSWGCPEEILGEWRGRV